jgi:hypothetical protein
MLITRSATIHHYTKLFWAIEQGLSVGLRTTYVVRLKIAQTTVEN